MISKHISYREATRSNTAMRLEIVNTPNHRCLEAMKKVANAIFEPLRRANGNRPIRINSFYRSKELNTHVGGSTRSQHCNGEAIDLDDTYGGMTNAEMFDWIRQNMDYDQLIWEFGDGNNPDWVHVSFVSPGKNRNRSLRAVKRWGIVSYIVMQ